MELDQAKRVQVQSNLKINKRPKFDKLMQQKSHLRMTRLVVSICYFISLALFLSI